jgi:hypothetical protein
MVTSNSYSNSRNSAHKQTQFICEKILAHACSRTGKETSFLFQAEVKDAWSYTSSTQYVFMASDLVKHRDNFTLPLYDSFLEAVHPAKHHSASINWNPLPQNSALAKFTNFVMTSRLMVCLAVRPCLFCLITRNKWTYFHQTWYEYHTTEGNWLVLFT